VASLKKQSKEVLREKKVVSMNLVFQNNETKLINLEGEELSEKAIKRLLESIKWDKVAEVTFEVDEESDGDQNEGDEDEDEDGDYDDEDYDDDDDDDDDEDYDDDDDDDDDEDYDDDDDDED
jgi:hypothetical protein